MRVLRAGREFVVPPSTVTKHAGVLDPGPTHSLKVVGSLQTLTAALVADGSGTLAVTGAADELPAPIIVAFVTRRGALRFVPQLDRCLPDVTGQASD